MLGKKKFHILIAVGELLLFGWKKDVWQSLLFTKHLTGSDGSMYLTWTQPPSWVFSFRTIQSSKQGLLLYQVLACSAIICSFCTHCSVPEMCGRLSIHIYLPPLSDSSISIAFQVGTCSFASVQVSQWAKACQSPGAGPCGQLFSFPSFQLLLFRLCFLQGFGAAPYILASLSF